MAILAVAAIYFVEITGRFQLPRSWANAMSIVAVSIWLAKTMTLTGETQLIAVTYVLLFLQLVLFFQAKGERIYWQLLVLNVAQAAVASALGQGLLFAVLLSGYLMLGIVALALLLMHRELARFDRSTAAAPAAAVTGLRALLPATAARPALQFVGAAAELPQVDYRRTLAHQTAGIVLGSLFLACPVYLLFPRVERDREYFEEEIRSVGYSKEVTLGEQAGEATLNPDVVMRVQLFDEPSGTPFQLTGEPLFRGSVASRYSLGTWTNSRVRSTYPRPLEPIRVDRYTRQHITIEKLNETTLFSIVPAYRVDDDERLRVDNTGSEIFRPTSVKSQRMEFDLATTGIYQRKQSAIGPLYRWSSIDEEELLKMPDAGPNQPDVPDPLAGLRAAAERVRRRPASNPTTGSLWPGRWSGTCDSGQFQYTLEGQKAQSLARPDRGFRGRASPRALRVLCRGPGPDAPQPGHPGPDCDRFPLRRMELGRRLLPGPPAARPHLG